jgi:hypothetical protein
VGGGSCGGYWYGESLLYLFSSLRLGIEDTEFLAYFIIALFCYSIASVFKLYLRTESDSKLIYTFIFIILSPPYQLLLQRGNIDILVFSILFVAWKAIKRNQVVITFVCMILVALVKFYSIPVLFIAIFLTDQVYKRFLYLCLSIACLAISLQSFFKVKVLQEKTKSMEQMFGLDYPAVWINSTKTYEINTLNFWLLNISIFLITLISLIFVLNKRTNASTVDISLSSNIFSAIIIFIYGFGANVDYRLVFVAFASFLILYEGSLQVKIVVREQIQRTLISLTLGALWLSYPAGKLQIIGDLAISCLVCGLIMLCFGSILLKLKRKRSRPNKDRTI